MVTGTRIALYRKTYPTADYDSMWEAFDAVTRLWTTIAADTAEFCDYVYSKDTEKEMLSFIKALR